MPAGNVGAVKGRVRPFLSPRWLAWHALLLTSLAVLGWIGFWQWDKARGDGDWQNYGYAVQWWLFAGFAVFLWVKLVLDELYPERVSARSDEPPMPQPDRRPTAHDVTAEDDDDELAAYNRRLSELADRTRE